MIRNPNFDKVPARYLFQEIRSRANAFSQKNPDAKLIRLGIGDTTEPVGPYIAQELARAAAELGTLEGYSGYGPEQGIPQLREAISQVIYNGTISADDIFVSDGAKCDLGRLQLLFGSETKIALQDPAYPVYLDSSIIYRNSSITFLPCTPENGFMPDMSPAIGCDLLFLCLPNNPTGTVLPKEALQHIVQFAKANSIMIIFDAAYSFYIEDNTPKSIYEIDGAQEVAIELGSFSKIAGFSGVRLGWTVVPEALRYRDGKQVKPDWMRINGTFFNGASILSQKGGIAALSPQGLQEVANQVNFYKENVQILTKTLQELGFETYGGIHSPYVWTRIEGLSSWEAFDLLLEKTHIVTTPGSGFGPAGEGFLRVSGFATRASILEATRRLSTLADQIEKKVFCGYTEEKSINR